MKKKCLTLGLAAALAVSAMAGCGSSGSTLDMASQNSTAATEAAYDSAYLYDAGYGDYTVAESADYEYELTEAAMPTVEAPAEAGGKAEEVTENSQTDRKLITTMNVSAETEYFDELMANLEQKINELGGYIESSDQWNGSLDYYGNRINDRSASLTVRIPAEKLDSFLSMVEENSNITNKSKNVEDVTLAYVDLESHKKALLTEEERLLELMEMAETVEDLITIEDKLANVRYQLESMESQLRTYDNRIHYSTIYLNISEVTRLTPQEEPTTWGKIKSGFAESVYEVGVGIRDFFIGLIVNIPFILLWLVILALVLFVVFLLARWEKKRKAKRQMIRAAAGMAPVMPENVPVKGKLPIRNPAGQTEEKQGGTPETPAEMTDGTMPVAEKEKKNESEDDNSI